MSTKQQVQQEQKGKKGPVRVKKRDIRTVPVGVAHVKSTYNNTIISVTDPAGNVIAWSSAGKVKFSGSRKSSAFAATVAAQNVAKEVINLGMKELEIILKGPGTGRESAVRAFASSGLIVTMIRDMTPIPHNGCRARKPRRV